MIGILGPVVIIAVMFIFLFRSQRKEAKKREEMLKQIKKGDKIITAGGLHGVVTNVKEKSLMVRIADNVKVEVARSGVSGVLGKNDDDSKGDGK